MRRAGVFLAATAFAAFAAARASCLQPPSGAPGGLSGVPLSSTASLRDRAFVLCWHSFLGEKTVDTDFSTDELAAQIDALAALGYRFIGLDDALFGRIEGALNLVATIDDGHRTITEAVSKVFASRRIAPALLVYPAVIGASQYFMKTEDVRRLGDSGYPIGAHGFYHLFLGPELRKENPPSYSKEIFKAKDSVEALSGQPAYIYAYPFGAYDDIAKKDVARAGYAFGLAVKQGFVYKDGRFNDAYELPRTVVTREGWAVLYAFLKRNAESAKEPASSAAGAPVGLSQ